ncbi:MAG TPA: nuclear transport factor 2 family protein [Actinomycetota bacterium]|jgi:hypothetical protein|nr:nuclear transport factor 2 family protein [Actinomycetota bacterium]
MPTEETQRVAQRYFDAWTSRRTAESAGLLADDFSFAAGDMKVEGKDAFLDAGAFPQDATTTMVSEAYQDDVAFQMYDATRGELTVRIVERLIVRDGLIVTSTFVTDMAAFMAFLAA